MRIVVALGGNALLRRGEPAEAEVQRRNVDAACGVVAELARHHRLVISHGNGPQVGLLALQAAAYGAVSPYPLDVLGAESEGMIGYLLEQGLRQRLPSSQEIATLLTQVVVDAADPAFRAPSKPVGPVVSEDEARRLEAELGYRVARDGDGFRRVVASPEPLRIVELRAIELLVDAGVILICTGGGGVPVVVGEDSALRGVEAVIDKDLSAALLGRLLRFDVLLMLTDVPGAMRDFGTADAAVVRRATPLELRAMPFPAGSMGPKVEAACRFVEETGGLAAIGALEEAAAVLRGEAGTTVAAAAVA